MGAENLTPTWFRIQTCQPIASRKDEETGEIRSRLKCHFFLTGPEGKQRRAWVNRRLQKLETEYKPH